MHSVQPNWMYHKRYEDIFVRDFPCNAKKENLKINRSDLSFDSSPTLCIKSSVAFDFIARFLGKPSSFYMLHWICCWCCSCSLACLRSFDTCLKCIFLYFHFQTRAMWDRLSETLIIIIGLNFFQHSLRSEHFMLKRPTIAHYADRLSTVKHDIQTRSWLCWGCVVVSFFF